MYKTALFTDSDLVKNIKNYLSKSTCQFEFHTITNLNQIDSSYNLIITDLTEDNINEIQQIKDSTSTILFLTENNYEQLPSTDLVYFILKNPTDIELEMTLYNIVKIIVIEDQIGKIALCDELTGLYNRKYVLNRLEEELSRAKRYELPITCLLIDIDYFKVVNDIYGFNFGDKVIRKISDILKEHVRKEDILTRYGDEEFLVALPNTNDKNAYILAERIRKSIKKLKLVKEENDNFSVTVSIGISTYPFPQMEPDVNTLVRYAEHALYNAKKQGKNKVVTFSQINFEIS